jgi:hypothetical protein
MLLLSQDHDCAILGRLREYRTVQTSLLSTGMPFFQATGPA